MLLSDLIMFPRNLLIKFFAYEPRIASLLQGREEINGPELASQILAELGISPAVRQAEKANVPLTGAVLVVVNYPLSVLEVLVLVEVLRELRPDIKLVPRETMSGLAALSDLLVPTRVDMKVSAQASGESVSGEGSAQSHLQAGGALVVYPARGISRIEPLGSKDAGWQPYFLKLASATGAAILPVCVENKNLIWWYGIAGLLRPLSVFAQGKGAPRPRKIVVRIGELLAPEVHQSLKLPLKVKAKLFRKHLYRLRSNKSALIKGVSPVAGAELRRDLIAELQRCTLLGETKDRKEIYLYHYTAGSALMREIGRLREHAFRLVGEGTDTACDIDEFDPHYLHILLWDRDDAELVGAYRLKPTAQALSSQGASQSTKQGAPLYTQTLFRYRANAASILASGLELGRSFVQPKYWGTRSLDYLWVGIAAFLRRHPQYRYLLGAVSISDSFSKPAQTLMVCYYRKYFGTADSIIDCQQPFIIPHSSQQEVEALFDGLSAKQAFVLLKQRLSEMGYAVPTLYKQYSALCEPGGTCFHGFNIDPDFNNCVDGLVVVDIEALTSAKRKRYGLINHRVSLSQD